MLEFQLLCVKDYNIRKCDCNPAVKNIVRILFVLKSSYSLSLQRKNSRKSSRKHKKLKKNVSETFL